MSSGRQAERLLVRSPRREVGGRRFAPLEELSLEPSARQAIKALPGVRSGLTVVREAAGPFGIPDFVAMVGGKDRLSARRRLDVPPVLNEIDASLVSAAAVRRPFTIVTLANRAGLPQASAQRRLPGLLRTGALLGEGNGLTRPRDLVPIGRLYAIEMKVRDWRRAVHQCRRYALWTDSYVLVMRDVGGAGIHQLVGAVSVDGGGLVVGGKVLLRPQIGDIRPGRRLLASEYFIAAL